MPLGSTRFQRRRRITRIPVARPRPFPLRSLARGYPHRSVAPVSPGSRAPADLENAAR